MINIVTIADREYLVDVGFGGGGAPTHPIPLISDQPSRNIGSQSVRLLFSSISDNTRKDKHLWCYQFAMEKTGPGSMGTASPRLNSCRRISK